MSGAIRIREGFRDQILYVVPRPILERLRQHPLLYQLVPTDIGFFPQARYHYCARPEGTPEHILIVCVDGAGWCQIGDNRHMLTANRAVLIPKYTPHVYGADENAPWTIHWVHLVGVVADYYASLLPEGVYTMSIDPHTTQMVVNLFRECYESFLGSFVLQRMIYISQTLHHLLGTLFFNNRAFSPTLRTSRFHNLEETRNFLRQNLHSRLTLDEMAAHARLSKSHFIRLFKEQTGYSPVDYFIHLKMQHACMLLSVTRKTVREIAWEIGYDDPYYFSRIFKKVIGMSPRRYREEQGRTHPHTILEIGDLSNHKIV
ncbi:MAG: AraC family transcriptional regulator [Anaerolineae bacterium]